MTIIAETMRHQGSPDNSQRHFISFHWVVVVVVKQANHLLVQPIELVLRRGSVSRLSSRVAVVPFRVLIRPNRLRLLVNFEGTNTNSSAR